MKNQEAFKTSLEQSSEKEIKKTEEKKKTSIQNLTPLNTIQSLIKILDRLWHNHDPETQLRGEG